MHSGIQDKGKDILRLKITTLLPFIMSGNGIVLQICFTIG